MAVDRSKPGVRWKAEEAKASADEAMRTAPAAYAHEVLKKCEKIERQKTEKGRAQTRESGESRRGDRGVKRLLLFFFFTCITDDVFRQGKFGIHIFYAGEF
jgi:hypothetical protein